MSCSGQLDGFIAADSGKVLHELHDAGCIRILDNDGLESTYLGNYTSFYYMSYKTAKFYRDTLAKILYPALIFGLKSTKESCPDCH